jgi:hypothetical protein
LGARDRPALPLVTRTSGVQSAHTVVTQTAAIARSIANLLLIFSSFVLFLAALGGPVRRTLELQLIWTPSS